MTTKRYLILATLWAALLPALWFHFLLSLSVLFTGIRGGEVALLVTSICALMFFAWLCWIGIRTLIQLRKTLQKTGLPASPIMRCLPFFLPLLYTLLLTIVGFVIVTQSHKIGTTILILGQPLYLLLHFPKMLTVSDSSERFVTLPLTVSIITAVIGSFWVSYRIPPVAQRIPENTAKKRLQ